eukprot:m.175648 g.175648  ORF g.175648 m.175648 type:complete len:62 (+) comp16549_c2_seq7:697-882(+)
MCNDKYAFDKFHNQRAGFAPFDDPCLASFFFSFFSFMSNKSTNKTIVNEGNPTFRDWQKDS